MISFETHRELYLFDSEQRVFDSLVFAKNLSGEYSEPVDFHFYWRVPRDFGRKQVLPIKSAIVSQNRSKTRFILWSNVDLSNNEYVRPLLPFIETRIWDPKEQSKNSPLDNANEFMYQWGSTGTHPNEPILKQNGAIMRLKSYSQLCHDLLNELAKTPADPNSTCWGTDLYHKVRNNNKNWIVFPCAWFNTEWGMGVPLMPFQKDKNGNKSSELFDGAFAWHWHNKWDDEIEEGSKFQILESIVEKKFRDITNV